MMRFEKVDRRKSALVMPIVITIAVAVGAGFFFSAVPCEGIEGARTLCDEIPPVPAALGLFVVFRLGGIAVHHFFLRNRPVWIASGALKGLGNAVLGMTAAAHLLYMITGASGSRFCTSTQVCVEAGTMAPLLAALILGGTTLASAFKKEERPEEVGKKSAPEDERRNPLLDLTLPLVVLSVMGVAGVVVFGSNPDRRLLMFGVLTLVGARAAARVIHYIRKPQVFYPAVVGVLRGAGWALLGVFVTYEFVPGIEATPEVAWQLAALIFAISILQSHKTLIKGPGLPILVVLLGAMGLGAWGGWRSLSVIFAKVPLLARVPYVDQFLFFLVAIYGVLCIRVLLAFASQEEEGDHEGVVGWMKANIWRNLVFLGLIGAYLFFRNTLAEFIPSFPVVEFSIGIFILGAVLMRLRTRILHTITEAPVQSTWRPHEQRVVRYTEDDYDRVNNVVGAFLETGGRRDEYAQIMAMSAHLDGEAAEEFVAPVRQYRDEVRHAALPYPAALVSYAAIPAGVWLALVTLVNGLPRIQFAPGGVLGGFPGQLGFLLVGVGLWLSSRHAHRSGSLPGLIGGAATGILFVAIGFVGMILDRGGPAAAPVVLVAALVVIGALATLAGLSARKLQRTLSEGTLLVETGAVDREKEARDGAWKHGKLVAVYGVAAFLVTVPLSVLLTVLAGQGSVSDTAPETFRVFQIPLLVLFIGLAVSSLARLGGYLLSRQRVKGEDDLNRTRRMDIHQHMMRSLGRA